MQTRVDPRGGAGAGQHVALVDEQRGGVDRHLRVGRGQRTGVSPVGRRAPPVEEARGRQHEGAEAQPDNHGTVGVRGS